VFKNLMYIYSKNKIKKFDKFLIGKKVLDVGAGPCYVSSIIKNSCGLEVTAIDIADFSKTEIKPVVFDGVKTDFSNDAFDTSVLIFILHHVEEQEALLDEIIRVTGKRLIILEDSPGSKIELIFNIIFDKLWNGLRDIKTPLHFKKAEEWKRFL
jgi:ubiquinone/menaquinone biosynthesis C-methylase UbiE